MKIIGENLFKSISSHSICNELMMRFHPMSPNITSSFSSLELQHNHSKSEFQGNIVFPLRLHEDQCFFESHIYLFQWQSYKLNCHQRTNQIIHIVSCFCSSELQYNRLNSNLKILTSTSSKVSTYMPITYTVTFSLCLF